MAEIQVAVPETALTTAPKSENRVERLSGFEAWEQEKQTDRYQRFYRLARRLKDEFRQSEEAVSRETSDNHSLPGKAYGAATELTYALIHLLEQAPFISEGLGNAEYPDYPYQEGFVEMLQNAIDLLGLPYEIKRQARENEVIEMNVALGQGNPSLTSISELPSSSS